MCGNVNPGCRAAPVNLCSRAQAVHGGPAVRRRRVEAVTLVALASRAEDDDPIRALAALAELRRQIERQEELVVRRARVRGLSWAAIATLLGVSRQAVHRKHSGS